MDRSFWISLIAALLGSGLSTTVLGALLLRRSQRITAEVQSHRQFQESALAEVFGPMKMQLGRTKRAFARWNDRNEFLEAEVLADAHRQMRDILLRKGHLIPAHLVTSAQELVEHFDAWLEEYDRVRIKKTAADRKHIFVGPKGFAFPRQAEKLFTDYADHLQEELYGPLMRTG